MFGNYRRRETVPLNVQTAAIDLLRRLIRDLPGSIEYLRARA